MSTNLPIFFESILYYQDQFPFLHLHLERIEELSNYYQVNFPMSEIEFENRLRATLKGVDEQKIRVKIKVHEDKLEIISAESEFILPYTFNHYPAIDLTMYPHYRKPLNGHSLWKYENPFIYQDSMEYARKEGASQAILLNENGNVVETSLSNFFYILQDKVYTPPLSLGAVNGVFRRFLISKMKMEERNLNFKDLNSMQECFVTSAVRGIVAVKSIEGFSYSTGKVKKMKENISLSYFY